LAAAKALETYRADQHLIDYSPKAFDIAGSKSGMYNFINQQKGNTSAIKSLDDAQRKLKTGVPLTTAEFDNLKKTIDGIKLPDATGDSVEKVAEKTTDARQRLLAYFHNVQKAALVGQSTQLNDFDRDAANLVGRGVNQQKALGTSAQQILANLNTMRVVGLQAGKTDLDIKKEQLDYIVKMKNTENAGTSDAIRHMAEQNKIAIATAANADNKQQQLTKEKAILEEMKLNGASELQVAVQNLELIKSRVHGRKEEGDAARAILDIEQKTASGIMGQLVAHEIDLLRLRGASEAQLAQANVDMQIAINGYAQQKDILTARLAKEKEITQEQMNQKSLSSEAIALWKTALTHGDSMARTISQVLAGQRGINSLSSKELNVFQKEFSGRYDQLAAQDFYKRGHGGIITPESQAAQAVSMAGMDARNFKSEATALTAAQNLATKVDVGGVSATVTIHAEATLDSIRRALQDSNVTGTIMDAVAKEILKSGSAVNSGIKYQIEHF
jgi:hypothetical protein